VSKRPPENLVVMGRIAAPYGVRGGIRVDPYTASVDGLLSFKTWWVGKLDQWRQYEVLAASARPRMVVATLRGCGNRDHANLLRGSQVAVPRSELPRTGEW
jgi:16S rRNA processing protein RimM